VRKPVSSLCFQIQLVPLQREAKRAANAGPEGWFQLKVGLHKLNPVDP
jgi:hypothetical protein